MIQLGAEKREVFFPFEHSIFISVATTYVNFKFCKKNDSSHFQRRRQISQKGDVGAKNDKKVMKTHRKVPEKCHFSPFGLNCGSETAIQARNSGPQFRPTIQAHNSGPIEARNSGPQSRPAI